MNPKAFDFAGENREKMVKWFSIDETHKDNLENNKRHKAVTQSDYFCLEMKLMHQHANVIYSMWNWVYNLEWLAGPDRNKEMEKEWAETSKIG